MFQEYELIKMDVQPASEWFLISAQWLKNWKLYIGFDGMEGGEFPGAINNDDIIEIDEGR